MGSCTCRTLAGLALLLTAAVALAAGGDLDASFGNGGRVTRNPLDNGVGGDGRAVLVQKDGKILVAGNLVFANGGGSGATLGVWRFLSNGDLDQTFGDLGVAFLPLEDDGSVDAMALQPNGAVVIAGRAKVGSVYQVIVARFTAGGLPDPDFSGGSVIFGFSPFRHAAARGVAVQADGKIVVAGSTEGTSGLDFGLARLTPGGLLDSSFDFDGRVVTDFRGASFDMANAVALQADGKIVAAGFTLGGATTAARQERPAGGPGPDDVAVARYLPNGRLDPAFDGDGRLTTDFSGEDHANSVALQKDGRIVVAGYSSIADHPSFALARYLRNGRLDRTFGGDGRVTNNFSTFAVAYALAVQQDGRIVAAGQAIGGTDLDFGLARYLKNGRLDPTFGAGDFPPRGQVETDFGSVDRALAVALQRDGRIVAAGTSGAIDTLAVARYLPR